MSLNSRIGSNNSLTITAIGRWAYQAKKEEEEQINIVLFVNEN
jgi:hypothetical protein